MSCSYSKEFSSSAFTDVENAFIKEYLPLASGDAVKVYLYGLFLCQNPQVNSDVSDISSFLNLSEEIVKDCFTFWEEFGLISIVSKEPFSVVYHPVIGSGVSSKPRKIKAEKYSEFTKGLQAIIPNRMISTGEYSEYFSIMETYSIKPDAMLMIVKYCADKKGSDISYRYISKVAKDFGNREITTVDKVEKELSSYVLRTSVIEKILKALSLRRQPEIEDSTLLKKWTEELGFDVENIIFAASKIKKGSVQKLDEFLLELYSIKSFSKEEIAGYMENKEKIFNLAIKINKALSIYVDVIDTVVDTYTKKWLSFGFTEDALLTVAAQCFKEGKNTLRAMGELIEMLRERGFIDYTSVCDYFEREKKSEEFIKKLLLTAGVNRRPNRWDKENYATWRNWNFSEEMILEAAKLSAGKSSPLAYLNGVLSNWKNNGVFSTSDIVTDKTPSDDSQETYNREYERRRLVAHQRAQKNMEKASFEPEFMEVYGRLNGIEKDLAFAEIAANNELLLKLENEKKELNEKLSKILKNIGLTISDLSPKFACEKCKDTGYVGTHRCDCYGK
ncbi:MAG: DnaD domain protein [Clostridia bacterium]|nr:DnaD domain protein [Clostridia bacterium]